MKRKAVGGVLRCSQSKNRIPHSKTRITDLKVGHYKSVLKHYRWGRAKARPCNQAIVSTHGRSRKPVSEKRQILKSIVAIAKQLIREICPQGNPSQHNINKLRYVVG